MNSGNGSFEWRTAIGTFFRMSTEKKRAIDCVGFFGDGKPTDPMDCVRRPLEIHLKGYPTLMTGSVTIACWNLTESQMNH